MAKRSKKKNRRRRRRHKNPGVGAWVGSFLLTGLATGATNVLIPGASLPVTIAGLALVGSDTIKVEDKSVRSGILWSLGVGLAGSVLLAGLVGAIAYKAVTAPNLMQNVIPPQQTT